MLHAYLFINPNFVRSDFNVASLGSEVPKQWKKIRLRSVNVKTLSNRDKKNRNPPSELAQPGHNKIQNIVEL